MSFLRSLARRHEISRIGHRGISGVVKIREDKISGEPVKNEAKKSNGSAKVAVKEDAPKKAHDSIRDAVLKLVEENAKFKKNLVTNAASGATTSIPTLLGVPWGKNSPSFLEAPAIAPSHIREAIWSGSSETTITAGNDFSGLQMLADVGDIPIHQLKDCGMDDNELKKVISDAVTKVLKVEQLCPIVLGGDDSVSHVVVKAIHEHYNKSVDILHFDLRPDLSTFSSILEGNCVRHLVKVGSSFMKQDQVDQTKEHSSQIIRQYDIEKLANDSSELEKLALGDGGARVYVSIDLGCLDPTTAPGVSHYQLGGLAFKHVLKILQNLKQNIIGADVVGYNPKRDINDLTATIAANFVKELAAKMAYTK